MMRAMETITDIEATIERYLATWNEADDTVAVAGVDVVTLAADGRIQMAAGFFGDADAAT